MRTVFCVLSATILMACNAQPFSKAADNQDALAAVVSYCVKPLSNGEEPKIGLTKVDMPKQSEFDYYSTRFNNVSLRLSEDRHTCELLVEGLGYSVDKGFSGKKNFSKRVAAFKRSKKDLEQNGRNLFGFLSKSDAIVTLTYSQSGTASIWTVKAEADHPDKDKFIQ